MDAAKAAIYVVLFVLVCLGYTIRIKKTVPWPTTALEFFGLTVNSERQSFPIPCSKIDSLAVLREHILPSKLQVSLKMLQHFQGKCVSFSLVVPATKIFIREIRRGIASANDKGFVSLNKFQTEEVLHWRFLDDWRHSFPWREENNHTVSLSTDGSCYGLGCLVHGSSRDQS